MRYCNRMPAAGSRAHDRPRRIVEVTVASAATALAAVATVLFAATLTENTATRITHDRPLCWSLADLPAVADRYVVVYDFSRVAGTKLGTPWTLVAQGTCYPIDESDERVYAFRKPLDPGLAAALTAPEDYPGSANLTDLMPPVCGGTATSSCAIKTPPALVTAPRPTNRPAHASDIPLVDLLPTHYIPGEGFTAFDPLYGHEPDVSPDHGFSHDARTAAARTVLETLAAGLTTTIRTCDTRTRVEFRDVLTDTSVPGDDATLGVPSLLASTTVWRLASGADVAEPPSGQTFLKLALMGCTNAVGAYLRSKQADITELDQLLSGLEASYYPRGSTDGTYAMETRNPATFAQLTAFVTYGTYPPLDLRLLHILPALPQVVQPDIPIRASLAPSVEPSIPTPAVPTPEATSTPEPVATATHPALTTRTRPVAARPASASMALLIAYFAGLPLVGMSGLAYVILRRRERAAAYKLPDDIGTL